MLKISCLVASDQFDSASKICDAPLRDLWRGKARPGKSGEVAIRMLLEVGLDLFAPIAVS